MEGSYCISLTINCFILSVLVKYLKKTCGVCVTFIHLCACVSQASLLPYQELDEGSVWYAEGVQHV